MQRGLSSVLLGLALGCSGLDVPPPAEAPEVELRPDHNGEPLRVLRIRARSRTTHPLEADALWLFGGELSDYHLGRVERHDLPETLAARIVPAEAWQDVEGWATLAPHAALQAGATYTLAAPGYGFLTAFVVSASDATPLLERVWPPRDLPGMAAVVACAADVPREPMALALEPNLAAAELTPDFGLLADGRRCVRIHTDASALDLDTSAVLPPQAQGFLLDPAPLRGAEPSAATELECFAHELALGPGCAVVEDDRIELAPMPESLLWRIQRDDGFLLRPIAAGQAFVLRGLLPDSEQHITGSVLSTSGHETRFDVVALTQPARAHVTLSEVLANPLGPEPASEWVELTNDADVALDLGGFSFGDASGSAILPDAQLPPRGYALLVRADFMPGVSSDVAVPAGTPLIVLPTLGAKGLGNSGETLWLQDRSGRLLSEFPARPAPRAGVSVARSSTDPGLFGFHAQPGASPGAANALEGETAGP